MEANYYRKRVADCCLRAVINEDVGQRSHWLEAAARWLSLAREEGILPQELRQPIPRSRELTKIPSPGALTFCMQCMMTLRPPPVQFREAKRPL